MPTTLIFGASRGLGRAFTQQALLLGHRVVALVRHVDMATELQALGVEVVIGDALDPQAVAQACLLAGSGALVVSTLGSFRQVDPVDYLGNRQVVDEMERAGLRRLLLVTSLGCGDSWQYLPERARVAFGHEVRLKSLAESWLQTSTLDWTILRPAGLQDGEACGQAVLSQGEEVHGLVRPQDVAIRGLRLLTDQEACGQIYAIADPSLSRGGAAENKTVSPEADRLVVHLALMASSEKKVHPLPPWPAHPAFPDGPQGVAAADAATSTPVRHTAAPTPTAATNRQRPGQSRPPSG